MLLYSSNLSLGVFQLAGYLLHQPGSIMLFSGAVAEEKWKTSARGVFAHTSFTFLFVLLYFIYFTCIVLSKTKKN
jgi:hypothetical protein